ncbi:hypothetical protein NB643_04930 [Oxalobacter aliiformigenes]|uniref:Uncharacterized protein n=1 Tax=Oxalobacter aliiformigenes TaxID=2946593 RepID=A0ABY7JK51_9BURK|nr:hypothetical protein [Oxalobacter aliiformigenes]WAV92394.1 hypothetical protein NB641_06180 [Oxalobacter aliiformigenes]WAV96096.1 hypothetical protein NB643_04930 [Oxalobacter aliiformigenes]WAV97988.1 hypothetical protein NB645_04485 [Oxalobacter aliiformigenes]
MPRFLARIAAILLFALSAPSLTAQTIPNRHIAASMSASFFVDPKGTLWGWGCARLEKGKDKRLPGIAMTGAESVFVDPQESVFLTRKRDGSLWGWGQSSSGELGVIKEDGYGWVYTPRKLANRAIYALSNNNTFILDPDGTLRVWGEDRLTRGDNRRKNPLKPAKILDNVAQFSSSLSHTLALKKDGSLWAWGENQCGTLGTGENTFHEYPVPVDLTPLGTRKIVRVATRMTESFLVADDGTVWNWGEPNNMKPYCMDAPRWVPTLLNSIDNVADIAVGEAHELYLKKDGSVWMIAYLAREKRTDPVKVMDNAAEIAAGSYHSLVLKKDGSLWAWGENECGQLGDGTYTVRNHPTRVRFDLSPDDLPPPEDSQKTASGASGIDYAQVLRWEGGTFDLCRFSEEGIKYLDLPPELVEKLRPCLRQRQENTGDSQEDSYGLSDDDIDILNMIILYNINRQNGKETGFAKQ